MLKELTKTKDYLAVYFSMKPLDDVIATFPSDEKGIYIPRDIWKKETLFEINAPIHVHSNSVRYLYRMHFCSEYIELGKIVPKDEVFGQLVKEVLAYKGLK